MALARDILRELTTVYLKQLHSEGVERVPRVRVREYIVGKAKLLGFGKISMSAISYCYDGRRQYRDKDDRYIYTKDGGLTVDVDYLDATRDL